MALNSRLCDIVQFRKNYKGFVGVEVEMEAENMLPQPEQVNPRWHRMMDGSLRGRDSAEYVLPNPVTVQVALERIDFLDAALKRNLSEVRDTVRAGVHVHLNMQEEKLLTIFTFLSCYFILEEALCERFCGEGRSGNHFCLRAVDSDFIITSLSRAIARESIRRLKGDQLRYAACNLSSLITKGSLEFRALRTPKDLEKIKTWIKILVKIKEQSALFNNPREVVEQFSMGGEFNFLHQMLGPLAEHLGPQDHELSMMLMRGVRLTQEIAYSKQEWKDGEQ